MPVSRAQYYALLARALPGTPIYDLRWNVSRVEGWSLIHAAGILHGESFIWPDARLSRTGRSFLRLQEVRKAAVSGKWVEQLGL